MRRKEIKQHEVLAKTKSFKVDRLPNQELSPNTKSHHMKKSRAFREEKERFEADLIYNSCIFDLQTRLRLP